MAIKNLGTITSVQQKMDNSTFEKKIRIHLDLNVKEEENKEYNIYIQPAEKSDKKERKGKNKWKAKLIQMDQEFSIEKDFDISLNKKYDFELDLDKDQKSIIGLTEISEI